MTESGIREPPMEGPELEALVVEFLDQHRDFFQRHQELLIHLSVPHPTGGAISLIERQVEALRGELASARGRIGELARVARRNERLNRRLHRMTLDLIDAVDFTDVLNTLEDHLHEHFGAEAVELKLFSSGRPRDAQGMIADPAHLAFMEFFASGRPVCGHLTRRQLDYLFGPQAEDMRSAALLPLRGEELLGVLAMGSSDPERFQTNLGVGALNRLAEIVSRKLQVVSLPGV